VIAPPSLESFWARDWAGTPFAAGSVIAAADLPSASYHQTAPGVSKSGLDRVRVNLRRLLVREEEAAPHLDLGGAVNDALLHPDTFAERYVRGPEDRRGNRWKEAAEAAAMAGVTVLVQRDYDLAVAMRDALLLHPHLGPLLEAGAEREPSYFWEDPETGLLCRCRPDVDLASDVLLDVKTAADASWEPFRSAVFRHRYHVQNAFYSEGRKVVRGDCRGMVFVVVDKEDPRPENVALYQLDDELYERGWRAAREDLRRLAEFLDRERQMPGQWTGYPLEVQLITFRRDTAAELDAGGF